MAEQSVCTGRAVVYYFDSAKKTWAPSPVAAYTRLDIYKNTATSGYRVIGRGIEDANTIVINSPLSKDTVYVRSQEQFHQFQDPRYLYGLNFATPGDALGFATEFEKAVHALKGAGGASAPPPTQPRAPATPLASTSKPIPATAPSTGPSKPPPMPPKAPPKPPPTRAAEGPPADSPGRDALLGSIQGFAKNKLKKAETTDKSAPILTPAKPALSTESSDGSATRSTGKPAATSGGGGDMMASIMAKRAAMQKPAAEPKPVEPKPAEHKKAAPPPVKNAAAPPKPDNRPPVPAPRTPKLQEESTTAPVIPVSVNPSLPDHLQVLKEEILAEVRLELAQMKIDLINAIQGQY